MLETTPALPVAAFAQGSGVVPILSRSADVTALRTVASSERLVSDWPPATVPVEMERSTLEALPNRSRLLVQEATARHADVRTNRHTVRCIGPFLGLLDFAISTT